MYGKTLHLLDYAVIVLSLIGSLGFGLYFAKRQTNTKTYFVASFSAILPSFWKRLLLHSQWIKYYFVSPAFRYALYLENRILAGEEGVGSAGISFPGRVPEKTFRNLLSGT